MRDLIVSLIIFGSLPFILRNPFVGLLMWVWIGIMNPHRFGWGFAYNMPFAQIVVICTLLSMLMHSKKLYRFPTEKTAVFLVMLILWIGVSPWFSFHPDKEFEMWLKPAKILFMTLVALLLVGNRDQLNKLVWVLALSVGFFGIKGGIFTILTGGSHRVYGPADSFIAENNALALAIIMTVPLFRYMQLHANNIWIKRGCIAAMLLCLISALGSQSRGALLALVGMGVFLFFKSSQKSLIIVIAAAIIPLAFLFMPEQWSNRMATIQTFDTDDSAMGRINAWWMAWSLAVDRFPIGGGFSIYELDVFQRYAPDPMNVKVAHSIYFQILGEHGFIGLALFLAVFVTAWMTASKVIRATRQITDWRWAHDLASMCQVSLAGYAIGGAFLNLSYFDLPYYVAVIVIVLQTMILHALNRQKAAPSHD